MFIYYSFDGEAVMKLETKTSGDTVNEAYFMYRENDIDDVFTKQQKST